MGPVRARLPLVAGLLFVVAYATGDEVEQVHIAAGYAIAGLLAPRIIWGFVGPRHARFASFVRPPRKVLTYLRDVALRGATLSRSQSCRWHHDRRSHRDADGNVRHRLHDDDGRVLGIEMDRRGPRGVANRDVGLVVVHVLGVLVASFEHRENLVKAMITGRKKNLPESEDGQASLASRHEQIRAEKRCLMPRVRRD